MAVIGIIIALVLATAQGAQRSAERAATQALITKLDIALTERLDALASQRVIPTFAHQQLAAIYRTSNGAGSWDTTLPGPPYWPIKSLIGSDYLLSNQRAQVIAQYDFIKSEMPDVFVIDSTATATAGHYPLNFAAIQAPGRPDGASRFELPMGCDLPHQIGTVNLGIVNHPPIQQTGAYGASFSAAAGVYKNLGYAPAGYDGNDNNNDGFIDDYLEGITGLGSADVAKIASNLSKHTHKTARAEMLYALLVEGQGPLGSSFNRDDFTNREVQDTDGDGLPEFIDAWGEPLQFYRWPIGYQCDSIAGFPTTAKIAADTANSNQPGPYESVFQAREQAPLDPNQQLMAPAWWSDGSNFGMSGGGGNTVGSPSEGASQFANYFHALADPYAVANGAASAATYWDRGSTFYVRRAYYSRPLVLSGGPDKLPGTAQLNFDYPSVEERWQFPLPDGTFASGRDKTGIKDTTTFIPANLVAIENQAARVDPSGGSLTSRNDTTTQLEAAAGDDIANLNENAPISAVSR